MFRCLLRLIPLALILPLHAQAASLTAAQILSQFNVVVSGTFNTAHDVEGRLVAKEIASAATLYLMPSSSAGSSSFQAVNAITVDPGVHANVNSGGSVDVQGANGGTFSFNGGGSLMHTPSFAITDFTAPLNSLSSAIHGLTANSTLSNPDQNTYNFTETPNSSGTAVFRITAASLASAGNITFSGSATTVIVDVVGSLTSPDAAYSFAEGNNSNFNDSGTLSSHVIWNFLNAASVSFKGWHGAVLAGNATVSNTSAEEGFLYAKAFNGGGELHDRPFVGTLPSDPGTVSSGATPVDEPSSIAIAGMALLGLSLVRRRRA